MIETAQRRDLALLTVIARPFAVALGQGQLAGSGISKGRDAVTFCLRRWHSVHAVRRALPSFRLLSSGVLLASILTYRDGFSLPLTRQQGENQNWRC